MKDYHSDDIPKDLKEFLQHGQYMNLCVLQYIFHRVSHDHIHENPLPPTSSNNQFLHISRI